MVTSLGHSTTYQYLCFPKCDPRKWIQYSRWRMPRQRTTLLSTPYSCKLCLSWYSLRLHLFSCLPSYFDSHWVSSSLKWSSSLQTFFTQTAYCLAKPLILCACEIDFTESKQSISHLYLLSFILFDSAQCWSLFRSYWIPAVSPSMFPVPLALCHLKIWSACYLCPDLCLLSRIFEQYLARSPCWSVSIVICLLYS